MEERHCKAGAQTSGGDTSRIQRGSPVLLDFICLGRACLVSTSGDGGDEADPGSVKDGGDEVGPRVLEG